MQRSIEAKGDTIDVAVENALQQLGMHRDDVSVEVLQNPKSGFLGLGREPAIVRVSYQTSPAGKAKTFLEGLLIRFGAPAQIHIAENFEENAVNIELVGGDTGTLIGRRGETLDAIQYLTGIVVNRDEADRWRVTIDAEGYRAKRETSLQELAQHTAQKALKYKKPVALEPMNPQERRIVHSCLQDYAGVTTYSIGTEPNRKVIVAPEGSRPIGGGQTEKAGIRPWQQFTQFPPPPRRTRPSSRKQTCCSAS